MVVSRPSGRGPVEPGAPRNRRGRGTRLFGLIGGATFGGICWGVVFRGAYAGSLPQPLLDAGFAACALLAASMGVVCLALALLVVFAVAGKDSRLFARITYLMELLPRVAAFGSVVRSGLATPDEVLPHADPLPLGQSVTVVAGASVEDDPGHGDGLPRQRPSAETESSPGHRPRQILDPTGARENGRVLCHALAPCAFFAGCTGSRRWRVTPCQIRSGSRP